MPRKWTLWAVVALLLLFAVPTRAQAQGNADITMEATALYEGTSKYGEWLPVVVTLTNEGADARGMVEIRVAGSDTAAYAQIVELPRGARKAVTVYAVPNNFARRMVVTFTPDGSDEALAETEVTVKPVPTIRYVVAGITNGGTGLEALAGINFRGEEQDDKAVIVPLSLEQIPDRPEALRTLDLLVITGVDTSSLTPRQQAALEQYVALGGVLVLGGGPDASRVLAGLPDSIKPVTLSGEQQLDTLPGLAEITDQEVRVNGPFTLAQGTPKAEAIVRYREGDTPLVVEQGIGDGAVLWMALDPSLSPFDAWAGVGPFWQQVVGARAYYPAQLPPDVAPRQMQTNDLFYALQNLPSLDLPSLRLLIPVLGVYILLVGPVNYFVLRRMRRLELAWITIPALTLLFSLGSYGLGYGLRRGDDVIVNQVALIRGLEGGNSAYIRSLVGIFSPARRSYDLAVEGDVLLSPTTIEYDPFTGAPVEALDARLIQGSPALAQGLEVNQWSMRSVLAESFAPEGYGFEANLTSQDGELSGTITNNGTHVWKDALMILGTQFVRLGDVAPGESKEVTLKPDPTAFRDIYQLPYKIFETQLNQPNPPREAQVKQQILSTLFTGSYSMEMGTSLALSRNPVLMAWLDDAELGVRLNDNDRTSSVSTSLFYSPLAMDYQTGDVSFIQGTIETVLIENTGSFCYAPTMASLSPDFSTAEIEFRLPIAAENLDPTELSIYVTSDGMFAEPGVSLLNANTGEWEPISEIKQGENKVAEPDLYITREGTFRIQVENGQRFGGSCLFFDASLEGI